MTITRTELAIAAVLAAALLIAGVFYAKSLALGAVADAQDRWTKEQSKAIDAALEKKDKEWQAERADLVRKQSETEKAGTEKMVAALNSALGLKQPIMILPAAAQQGSSPQQDKPPAAVSVPAESIAPIYKAVTDLQICKGDLAACSSKVDAGVKKSDLLQKDLDAQKSARKGGSWKQRAVKGFKCIGLAAGGSGVGYLVNSKSWKGPVIGAAAGTAGCEIFF